MGLFDNIDPEILAQMMGGLTPEALQGSFPASHTMVPPTPLPPGVTGPDMAPQYNFNDPNAGAALAQAQAQPGVTRGVQPPPSVTAPPDAPVMAPEATLAQTTAPMAPQPAMNPQPAGPPADVGGALTGQSDMSAQAKPQQPGLGGLAGALRGVQAPRAPELQKIQSPSPPRPTTNLRTGNLQALLQMLNAGSGRGPTLGRG